MLNCSVARGNRGFTGRPLSDSNGQEFEESPIEAKKNDGCPWIPTQYCIILRVEDENHRKLSKDAGEV